MVLTFGMCQDSRNKKNEGPDFRRLVGVCSRPDILAAWLRVVGARWVRKKKYAGMSLVSAGVGG